MDSTRVPARESGGPFATSRSDRACIDCSNDAPTDAVRPEALFWLPLDQATGGLQGAGGRARESSVPGSRPIGLVDMGNLRYALRSLFAEMGCDT